MGELFYKNKYRIPSARLEGWDYGSHGFYFVTICVREMKCVFVGIHNNIMCLNRLGATAQQCWQEIPRHFPFVQLCEFIVMPNHVHGVLEICDGSQNVVETQDFASLHETNQPYKNKFGPQSKNIASIIRGFKIGVTKYARNNNIEFQWQPRFYDHIIRNESALYNIREYIRQNPAKWHRDRNNKTGIFM